ncbi:MAG: 4Fe-4S cluster-binding domain-containing protein [Bacteroidales bacterium]|nr:4Fe-4S cluster-binding domain-containing protein [Bacteroidales bacterium]
MKFVDTRVVFREVPDEIALAINISGCPVKCPGCHSSYLSQDIGEILDKDSLCRMIRDIRGITCVSFMGGDADPMYIRELALWVRSTFPGMKTCWYSGRSLENASPVVEALDFLKVGPYIDECGSLDSETTNQRFYRIIREGDSFSSEDHTSDFKKKIF